MEISKNFNTSSISKYEKDNCQSPITKPNVSETSSDVIYDSSDAKSSYVKAGINIQRNNSIINTNRILKDIISPDETIHREHLSKSGNIIRLKIGKEIKGFKGIYSDDKSVCCYLNNDGEPEDIYIKNNKTDEISVHNVKTGEVKQYTNNDIQALSYYKNHPQWLHPKLRFNQNKCSGMFLEELEKVISTLDDIFLDENKVEKNKENKILYRALQSNLSEEDMEQLQTIGGIFTEKSFCSTATDLSVAKRFVHHNPILEIEFPKDAKYVDIEKLSNIDTEHFRESELLLDRNSHFIVTGFKPDENIIQVKYLGSRGNL